MKSNRRRSKRAPAICNRSIARGLVVSLIACGGLASVLSGAAWAQAYPGKPVRVVVASSAGSNPDTVGRIVASGLAQAFGQQASGRTMAENATLGAADGMRMALELGRAALTAAPTAQGLILPGGRWLSIHAVAALEAEFGKPVFLNLNSSLWAALRSAGRGLPVVGQGMLLAS